jgi:hypothetical protein
MKEQVKSRRSFIFKTIGAGAAITMAGWFGFKRVKKNETVKMLTQDGRLVEIDKNVMHSCGKINEEDIHTWVNNKHSKTK